MGEGNSARERTLADFSDLSRCVQWNAFFFDSSYTRITVEKVTQSTGQRGFLSPVSGTNRKREYALDAEKHEERRSEGSQDDRDSKSSETCPR